MKSVHLPFLLFLMAALPALSAWKEEIPDDIAHAFLDSDRVLSESPCNWRDTVGGLFRPLVRDCSSAREAALLISSRIGQITGVYYSPERRKPDMNALEALDEKKVSCTGQSILLVCAYRSVGLPARAVGIPTWNHVAGNHTWVEVWFDGQWHMIEFKEKEFNTPWVMENIGMLDPDNPWQHIYAVASRDTGITFPLYTGTPPLPAEDVTGRYRQLAANWYAAQGFKPDSQRLMLDIQPREEKPDIARLLDEGGQIVEEKPLPSLYDDMRQFSTFTLPRNGRYYLQLPDSPAPMELKATNAPVQILRMRKAKE